jgi:HAD superfamily hydrolase (TIGR01450 family)
MDRICLSGMEAFLFDLDGCLYYGNVPATGAGPLLQLLKDEGKSYFFITNNSTDTAQEIASRLNIMGLLAVPRQVITATELTGDYIKDTYGVVKVKVAGSEGLRSSLEHAGHRVLSSDSQETADVVVIGRDTYFHYGKLMWIAREGQRGAKIIGTNPDAYHLDGKGEKVPETGSLTAAVEAMIGKKVEHVGKPEPYLFQYAMKQFHLKPETSVMVGDNINTDMLGGIRSGMHTVWVKGEENCFIPNEYTLGIQPDLIVSGIEHLLDLYKRQEQTSNSRGDIL